MTIMHFEQFTEKCELFGMKRVIDSLSCYQCTDYKAKECEPEKILHGMECVKCMKDKARKSIFEFF